MLHESNWTEVTTAAFETTMNSTLVLEGDPNLCIFAQEISLLFNVITLIVGLIIICGNILVIAVVLRYPAKKFTPLYWFLVHLAVADLSIGLTVFFWYGIAEILQLPITLTVKVFLYGISIVAVMASFQGLMMIAFDRYMLILHTVRYKSVITKPRTIAAIVFMWLFPTIIQVLAPMTGWSCVDLCDCRIHNIRPDDKYCFHPSCSQMLPPVKKLQLFLASLISCIAFVVTVALYAVMFYGIHKQSKRMRSSMASSRKSSSGSQNNTQLTPTSPRALSPTAEGVTRQAVTPCAVTPAPGWRDKQSDTRHAFRFDAFSNSLSQENNSNSDDAPPAESEGTLVESAPTSHPKPPPPTPMTPGFSNPVFYRANEPQTPTSPRPHLLEVPKVKLRPKNLNLKHTQSKRRSVTQSVIATLRGITSSRKNKRNRANRRRDVRVMRSMFIIMTVFVVTTCPLMMFILYTFVHNDRELKEIFNVLLQITTLNSLLNPFLYFSRIPAMRNKLKQLVNATYWRNQWRERVRKQRPKSPRPARTEPSESWESGQSE